MATKTSSTKKNDTQRQKALERLMGDPTHTRRPLSGYENHYEVSAEGALFSIRLKRFLKPVFDTDKNIAVIEFEHEGNTVRLSPGKAVAQSFFTAQQRERIVKEAHDMQTFDAVENIKKHPALEALSKKYAVTSGAIFYIMLASLAKQSHANS